jgi:hypothetical protein
VLHPWETGCDDSPRWDAWGAADRTAWRITKGELVASLVVDPLTGAPMANSQFTVGSVAFTALCAHAADELAWLTGEARWRSALDELATVLDAHWGDSLQTWSDVTDFGPVGTRTLEALLPLLVTRSAEAQSTVAQLLIDDHAYGGACGPAGVHRAEPVFEPDRYWRGCAWPQLTYLLWVAARRQAIDTLADELAARLVRGALTSGFAEHWHPDSGAAGGAVPQTWATLAAIVDADR